MNGSFFATFFCPLATGTSRRRLLARALVGVASPATIAHFALYDGEARKGEKKQKNVTLCRGGQTVRVSRKARKKLLRQGATVGVCQRSSPTLPPADICTPDCDSRECGDDGCGRSCGTCGESQICTSGQCQVVCPIDQVPCFDVCIPASCQSRCNEPCRAIGRGCCGPLTCKQGQGGTVACRP